MDIPRSEEEVVWLAWQKKQEGAPSFAAAIYAIIDPIMAESLAGLSEPVACHAGCALCCHQPVKATLCEWAEVWRYCKTLDPNLRLAIRARFEAVREEWNDWCDNLDSARTLEEQVIEYWNYRPCVFLDPETRCCLIYPARPYVCRVDFNLTECTDFLSFVLQPEAVRLAHRVMIELQRKDGTTEMILMLGFLSLLEESDW